MLLLHSSELNNVIIITVMVNLNGCGMLTIKCTKQISCCNKEKTLFMICAVL